MPAAVFQPAPGLPPRRRISPLRCCAIACLALVLLVGLVVLVFWLVVRPAPLAYTVDDAHVRDFNLTNDALSATFALALQSRNPNRRVSVYYDHVDVAVWYSDQLVALAEVPPFHQPRRSVRALDVNATAMSVPLLSTVEGSLKRDRSLGEAQLEVRVRARIRFKVGAAKTRHYTLRAYCSPVVVHFAATVAAPFQKVYCDVDV